MWSTKGDDFQKELCLVILRQALSKVQSGLTFQKVTRTTFFFLLFLSLLILMMKETLCFMLPNKGDRFYWQQQC